MRLSANRLAALALVLAASPLRASPSWENANGAAIVKTERYTLSVQCEKNAKPSLSFRTQEVMTVKEQSLTELLGVTFAILTVQVDQAVLISVKAQMATDSNDRVVFTALEWMSPPPSFARLMNVVATAKTSIAVRASRLNGNRQYNERFPADGAAAAILKALSGCPVK